MHLMFVKLACLVVYLIDDVDSGGLEMFAVAGEFFFLEGLA